MENETVINDALPTSRVYRIVRTQLRHIVSLELMEEKNMLQRTIRSVVYRLKAVLEPSELAGAYCMRLKTG